MCTIHSNTEYKGTHMNTDMRTHTSSFNGSVSMVNLLVWHLLPPVWWGLPWRCSALTVCVCVCVYVCICVRYVFAFLSLLMYSICTGAFVWRYHFKKCLCIWYAFVIGVLCIYECVTEHLCFCKLTFPRVSVCVFDVCPSWTGSRSPQHLGPCATCYGPTPWKTLAMRRPRSTLVTTQLEAAPISTGTEKNCSSQDPCRPYQYYIRALMVYMRKKN